MANIDFNINGVELTRQVFNLGAISVNLKNLPSSIDYDEIEVFEYNGNYPKSKLLNTPILDVVYFKEGNQTVYILDSSPIITIERPKRIVKSTIRRKFGTVKEFITLGDYVGTIRGTLVNSESLDPPYEQMAELEFLNEKTSEWAVEGDLFGHLNIFNIVIGNVKFVGDVGSGNSQAYEITFESDEPITLDV